jgi:erythronate-4-phosphate dehydrogenase
MKIIADENIPLVEEIFEKLGEVVVIPGRALTNRILKDADALLVRSITPVSRMLLDGSRIRFVGSATAGFDHVDTAYLGKAGISFAYAAGSNADSVTDYVMSLLYKYGAEFHISLEGLSLGVIGVGNVGRRVSDRAEKLGMKVLRNDPPLKDRGVRNDWHSFEDACGCDIVTLHPSLNKGGPYNTHHLFNEDTFRRMEKKPFFINSSRGGVTDNQALLKAIDSGRFSAVSLDVWENEPAVSTDLVRKVFVATPHIAGYSYDGKIRGTEMIYEGLCRFLGAEPSVDVSSLKKKIADPVLELDNAGGTEEVLIRSVLRRVYDLDADCARMKEILDQHGPAEQGRYFDMLRRTYPIRREFSNHRVRLVKPDAQLAAKLAALGFGSA